MDPRSGRADRAARDELNLGGVFVSFDDEAALRECRVPLLYIDAGTPNADLARAVELCPGLMIARTIGSGHFSPLVVPEQVNAVLERFLRLAFSG